MFYLYTCRTTEAYKLHKFIGQCQLKVKFIDRGHILLASIGLLLMENVPCFTNSPYSIIEFCISITKKRNVEIFFL